MHYYISLTLGAAKFLPNSSYSIVEISKENSRILFSFARQRLSYVAWFSGGLSYPGLRPKSKSAGKDNNSLSRVQKSTRFPQQMLSPQKSSASV